MDNRQVRLGGGRKSEKNYFDPTPSQVGDQFGGLLNNKKNELEPSYL